jgi:histidinol-phosphate aminotransferase
MNTTPQEPTTAWLNKYLNSSITSTTAYQLEKSNNRIKIDQNESPFDWPDSLKDKILQQLKITQWNRYPTAYCEELRTLVANYSEVLSSSVFLCAGSNYHISLIINLLCRNLQGNLIVARPSFPLYEGHCRYENIKYLPWNLNSKLEYDIEKLPQLTPGSVVILASPNNPTGSVLHYDDLEYLLKTYLHSYFIVDEAYYEFNDYSYATLLSKYSNLIILRTFSKAFSGAGVRLGYTVASSSLINELNKLTLPFMINHFGLIAMKTALACSKYLKQVKEQVILVKQERDLIYSKLKHKFFIPKSYANFLYLTCQDINQSTILDQKIKKLGLQGRLVAAQNFLPGVRVSIDTSKANTLLEKIK